MKETVLSSATIDAAILHKIADEATAAFAGGGGQVPSFSGRYPSLTLDDAYRVTAFANGIRIAQGHKPMGRKIGFTNKRLYDEYGVRAPIWGYVYDRTLHNLDAPLPLAVYAEPKIEPEIVFGLAEAPSPDMDDCCHVLHGSPMGSRSCKRYFRAGGFRRPIVSSPMDARRTADRAASRE